MKHVDLGLEQAVLSHLMCKPQRLFELDVREHHFGPGHHQALFRALAESALRGDEQVDLAVLRTAMAERGVDVLVSWLADIQAVEAVDGLRLSRYLRDTALRRTAYCDFHRALAQLDDASLAPQEVVADAIEALHAALHGVEPTSLRVYPDMLRERDEAILHRDHGVADDVPTGFPSLDRAIGGLPRRCLAICGGRTSRGKSVLLQQTCEQAAAQGARVLLCTPEMAWSDVADRGLARALRIDLRNLRQRNLTQEEETRLTPLPKSPDSFWVYDSRPQTTRDIARVAGRIALTGPLDVIAVDYLQYLNDPPRKYEPRYQQLDRIGRALRDLAAQLNTAVLAGAQLKRESDPEHPQLHDLRESGDLEQNADVVILLGGTAEDRMTLFIEKQRNGPIGKIDLGFERPYTRLTDPLWRRTPPEGMELLTEEGSV
jgi:replicative DNA helicase